MKAIFWAAFDNWFKDSLNLPHALLNIFFNGCGVIACISFTSVRGWWNHWFYLMVINLKEHLKDEMAAERWVNTLLRLWLTAVADDYFWAIWALGKRGDCWSSRGAAKVLWPWAIKTREVVTIIKTTVHWLVKLGRRVIEIGFAAALPEIGDFALSLGKLAGDEMHLLPDHV